MASDETTSSLMARPDEISQFLYPDFAESRTATKQPWWKFWAVKDVPSESIFDPEYGREIDIDKSWDAINFLLTQANEQTGFPSNFLLEGTAIGETDVGYGPARCFRQSETKVIDELLSRFDSSDLATAMLSKRFEEAEVYPFYGAPDPEGIEYVDAYLLELKAFVNEARSIGAGLIVYLS